jgi:hypothetical protein
MLLRARFATPGMTSPSITTPLCNQPRGENAATRCYLIVCAVIKDRRPCARKRGWGPAMPYCVQHARLMTPPPVGVARKGGESSKHSACQ